MKLTYLRKTKQSKDETVKKIKDLLKEKGVYVVGESKLSSGDVIAINKPEWVEKVAAADHNIIGLVPSAIYVFEKNGEVVAGLTNPGIINSIGHFHELESTIEEMDKALRAVIDEGTGAGDLKPTKVRLYSTRTCPYCQMEKKYLESKGVDFEYILVDEDPKAAQEMVQKTGQNGVPVTEFEFEGEDPEYIIGFDKRSINSFLGIK
jgi:glutaredoxin/uncharacterized protein (DUF302 family)